MASEPTDIHRAMSQALRMKIRGDFDAADRVLHDALQSLDDVESDARAELLAFRADLASERGSAADARRLYEQAHELSRGNPYRRYSIELSVGSLSERAGQTDEAARWYRHAISTAIEDEETSAGTAIAKLVALRGSDLSDEERQMCSRGVQHSWRVLSLDGAPDEKDLAAAAAELINAAGG